MSEVDLKNLAIRSVTSPAAGAREVLAFGLPANAGWMALVAVSAANALVFGISDLLFPAPEGAAPFLALSPMVYFGFLVLSLAATVFGITWVGQWMDGKGGLSEVLSAIVWLQALRVVAQVAALLLSFVSPQLTGLLVMGVAIWGVWMTAHFIDQAHGFGSPLKALGAVLLAGVGIIVVLSLVVSVLLGPSMGVAQV